MIPSVEGVAKYLKRSVDEVKTAIPFYPWTQIQWDWLTKGVGGIVNMMYQLREIVGPPNALPISFVADVQRACDAMETHKWKITVQVYDFENNQYSTNGGKTWLPS